MTTTSKPSAAESIGEGTRDLTYILRPPVLRRPYATGEYPTLRVAGPVVGADELLRLAVDETLVLPVDAVPLVAVPHAARHAAPAVYPQADERPERYRGRRRRPVQPWVGQMLIGAGLCLMAQVAVALGALSVIAVVQ